MKNLCALVVLTLVLCTVSSCKDKNSSDAIKPDYSATGNPYPNNQTVTGTTTYTSPATVNTTFTVGATEPGWSNPSCTSTQSVALRATKENIDVILTFGGIITNTTYAVSSVLGAGLCVLTVYNAPEQPTGIIWYGRGGTVSVVTTSNSINATLNNVVCTQKEFNFPQVSVKGGIGCSN